MTDVSDLVEAVDNLRGAMHPVPMASGTVQMLLIDERAYGVDSFPWRQRLYRKIVRVFDAADQVQSS